MLKRRDFLRATLFTAGALLVPGCGSDPEPQPEPKPERKLTDGTKFFPQSVASGDPRPDSVILWARVEDADASGDVELELEVATDEKFDELVSLGSGQAKVAALAKYDHCAKAKVTGLSAATVYYYRFIYVKGETNYVSRVGRTKTAPAAGADVEVKFAYVSCQDYIGRYYNSYALLAQEDVDFFVHLGDYIYETTGDPTFQNTTGRAVDFTDEAGAIQLGEGDAVYYAAKSLDNYRQLYKTYRSDPNLQAVHEKFAMIATWDDHEFSDDCHGATATYLDGRQDETDVARRKAADQAWFEYQPVDYQDEGFQYDPSAPFPGDIRIYRDFAFGKHVHLVVTDLRSQRADHLIPEDAFPGTVVVDQAAMLAELQAPHPLARPYIDVETYQGGAYKTALAAAAPSVGFDPAKVTGNIGVDFINALAAKIPQIPPIDDTDPSLEVGFSYLDLGKTSFYSSIGSRYLVVKDVFDVVARVLYKKDPKVQEVMGAEQEKWFLDTMTGSTATWKVWANEYTLSQLAIDLTTQPIPAAFKKRFYMSNDAWDGLRDKRSELLAKLPEGTVAITGDVHAFYAGTPSVNGEPDQRIVEFVGSSVSSATYTELLTSQVMHDPVLSMVPGAGTLAANIDALFLQTSTKINPDLGFADSTRNGYMLARASGDAFAVTMVQIPGTKVSADFSGDLASLEPFLKRFDFRTLPGAADLYQSFEGTWKRWDRETQTWI